MVGQSPALGRLIKAVRVLAESGRMSSAEPPDGSALEFDEAYTAFVGQLSELPTTEQMESLQRLDQQLESMSDPEHADTLWTPAAVKKDPAWHLVRAIASDILAAFEESNGGSHSES